jgi:hypothetical protein
MERRLLAVVLPRFVTRQARGLFHDVVTNFQFVSD